MQSNIGRTTEERTDKENGGGEPSSKERGSGDFDKLVALRKKVRETPSMFGRMKSNIARDAQKWDETY
jgi:hypothetical protein